MYQVIYSPRAVKSFKKIPKVYQIKIKNRVDQLSKNINTGTIRLVGYPVAEFRNRVGNYRVLFDKDEASKVIEILDIRKRDEHTYK